MAVPRTTIVRKTSADVVAPVRVMVNFPAVLPSVPLVAAMLRRGTCDAVKLAFTWEGPTLSGFENVFENE